MSRLVMRPAQSKGGGLSATALTTWMQCRKKSRLRQEGWRPIRPSIPMAFGTMAHGVLAKAFTELKEPPTGKWISRAVQVELDAQLGQNRERLLDEVQQALENAAGLLEVVLPFYFQHWKDDFKKLTWDRIEAEFRVEMEGVDWPLIGYFDRVFKLNGGGLWLVETKTSSKIDEESLVDTLHFDFQHAIYAHALWIQTGQPPKGIIRDIIRRPGQRQGVKESFQDYLNRVQKEIAKDPAFYFVRFEISLTKQDLVELKQDILAIAQEYSAWRRGELRTWRNTTACISRFGSCEFLKICSREDYSNYYQTKRRTR